VGGGAAVAGLGAGTTAKAGAGGGAFPQALSTTTSASTNPVHRPNLRSRRPAGEPQAG